MRLEIAGAAEGNRGAFSRGGWSASERSGRQDRRCDEVALGAKARQRSSVKSTVRGGATLTFTSGCLSSGERECAQPTLRAPPSLAQHLGRHALVLGDVLEPLTAESGSH